MGKYRDEIVKICGYAFVIRLAEIADEVDAKVDGVARTVASTISRLEELSAYFTKLDAKVAACCGGAPLHAEVPALRDEIATLKARLDALAPPPS